MYITKEKNEWVIRRGGKEIARCLTLDYAITTAILFICNQNLSYL
jgi:hypothetical protein